MIVTKFSRTLKNRKFLSKPMILTFSSYNSKIDASNIEYSLTKNPKKKLPYEELLFGKTFSDHMLMVDWDIQKGWGKPQIIPYGDIALSPASTCLQYGVECFEGMKAFKDSKGNVRMFRPDMNAKRLSYSMERMAMPPLDQSGFINCLKSLLKLDESWVPDQEGYSIYIRPTAIGISSFLGVQPPDQIKLYAIMSPVGPYFRSRFKPVKLLADTKYVRAWPGGVGNAKVGGNYGASLFPTREAVEKHNVSQILWLFGSEHLITEVGAMNIFFLLKTSTGVELVTPSLERGDILAGVTRDSILGLVRKWKETPSTSPLHKLGISSITVSERNITMPEVQNAANQGNLLEAFAAGTAAVISPVKGFHYNGSDISVPTGETVGPFAHICWQSLYDIQYGKVAHPWSIEI